MTMTGSLERMALLYEEASDECPLYGHLEEARAVETIHTACERWEE